MNTERQRVKLQQLLDSYKDLVAQQKDVRSALENLTEKDKNLELEIARLQGAMAVVRQDIEETEAAGNSNAAPTQGEQAE